MTKKSHDSNLSPANIEEAIMDVRNLQAPEDSAKRVARQVLQETGEHRCPTPPRNKRSLRALVAMGVTALALSLVVVFVMDLSSGSIVFAQVQQQLNTTQSLQYVEYLNAAGAQRRLEQAQNLLEMTTVEVEAMKASGADFDADEIERRTAAVEKFVKELTQKIENGDPVVDRRVWIQGRYLHRTEQPGTGSLAIFITNAQTGESVTLDPDSKRCTLLKTQTVLNMQTGEQTVTDLGPNPAENFYAAMTQIPPGEVTEVGGKKIDGKEAIGFQQTEDLHDCIVTRTYWIDKETQLPIQIVADVKRDGVTIAGGTMRDMVFNEKIDPTMFSTTPPEGYTVREGGIMGLDPGTPAQ